MAVTAEAVRQWVNAAASKLPLLEECLAYAELALDKLIEDDFDPAVEIPETAYDRALKLLTAEVFNQQQAPHGIVNEQFASEGEVASTPIRITRDPLPVVYPVLKLWSDGPAIG